MASNLLKNTRWKLNLTILTQQPTALATKMQAKENLKSLASKMLLLIILSNLWLLSPKALSQLQLKLILQSSNPTTVELSAVLIAELNLITEFW